MSGRHRPNKKQGTRVGYERDPAAETRRRRSEKSLPAAGQRIRRKTNFTRRSKTEPLSGEINEEKQASTYTESEWEIENKKIKKENKEPGVAIPEGSHKRQQGENLDGRTSCRNQN
jgi:hypothetical protein